jgi:DNA primase catalytic subunit
MASELRKYYKDCELDLTPITDLRFRHFRFLLPNGRFQKIPDRITNGEKLRKWLVRYAPLDVYYSTSCWLAPERIGPKDKTPLSDNVLIYSDLVFDIDRTPFSKRNIDSARKDTQKLIAFLDRKGIEIKYIAFSGSKGFHVICKDPMKYENPDPRIRESEAKKFREKFVEEIKTERIIFDEKVTKDLRRIIRVPGTVNSKKGYVCTVIKREDLDLSVSELFKRINKIDNTPVMPERANETILRIDRMIPGLLDRLGVRSKPQISFYASFLVNNVPGTRRKIPFFEYRIGRKQGIPAIKIKLSDTQKKYNLPGIYLFSSGTTLSGICLASFDQRRLEKIIKYSGSENYNSLIKYKQLFFRIGTKKDQEMRDIEDTPEYIETIENPDPKAENKYLSRPHELFLLTQDVPVKSRGRTHGTEKIPITHALIKTD